MVVLRTGDRKGNRKGLQWGFLDAIAIRGKPFMPAFYFRANPQQYDFYHD